MRHRAAPPVRNAIAKRSVQKSQPRAERQPRRVRCYAVNQPLILAEPDRPSWGFGEIFISAAIFLVLEGLVVSGASFILHDAAKLGYWEVAELFTSYLMLFGVLKVIFSLRRQPLLRSLGWVRQPFSPVSLVLVGFLLVLVSLLLQIVLRTPDIQTPFSKMLDSGLASRLTIALFGVTIGPIAEELLFRGLLQPVLINAVGVFPGILATAVLFGAMHLAQNADLWQAGVTITMAGFGFGIVRHISGSTRASSIVHVAYNVLPFLLTLLFPNQK
jgi:membrane protease YdiL (CAAX protease family)